MKSALVFDVDNTLTPPRRALTAEMAETLLGLPVPFHVAAGSDLPLVMTQLFEPLHGFGFRGTLEGFLCNGAVRYLCSFGDQFSAQVLRRFSLREHLGESDFGRLVEILCDILRREEFAMPAGLEVRGEQIVDRGAMLNLAPIGRPAAGQLSDADYRNREQFIAHDRRTRFRERMLEVLIRELESLGAAKGVAVTLGGETSFDIVVAGNDKSYALRTLLDQGYTQLTYIGDALFPGGNDAAILSFINSWPARTRCPVRAVRVTGWQDTIEKIRQLQLS